MTHTHPCPPYTGNVYAKYVDVDSAEAALNKLAGRFYAGRPIMAEYCIVTDFRDSRCRKYEESQCDRGGYCNFMHLKSVSRRLRRDLFENQPHATSKSRNRSKSRSKSRRSVRRTPSHTHTYICTPQQSHTTRLLQPPLSISITCSPRP